MSGEQAWLQTLLAAALDLRRADFAGAVSLLRSAGDRLPIEVRQLFDATTLASDADVLTVEATLQSLLVVLRVFDGAAIDWGVDEAELVAFLAPIYRQRNQTLAMTIALEMAEEGYVARYRCAPDAQIPVLDGLYQRLFGRCDDGVFVEVGAFDGESLSNTVGLADCGWRGVYIEPIPAHAAHCRRRHATNPRVSVVPVAISASDGVVSMTIAGVFSSIGHAATAESRALSVPCRRLDDVLVAEGIMPGFDLLVVDAEGHEHAVFAGFDLPHWRPRVMIVELPGGDPSVVPRLDWQDALRRTILDIGYREVYGDAINTVFADDRSFAV